MVFRITPLRRGFLLLPHNRHAAICVNAYTMSHGWFTIRHVTACTVDSVARGFPPNN